MMELSLSLSEYAPQAPTDVDLREYGIGIVGCGGIANAAHLPAYRKAGYQVVACCDVDEEAARSTAERWDIPFWTTDLESLLSRPEVAVIDLALHPGSRLEVLQKIAATPRPVLTQKPLHYDLKSALELDQVARDAGIVLAINQQARWNPSNRALKVLLDAGAVGDAYHIEHQMNSFQDEPTGWYRNVKQFNILDHGIHYLDLCRFYASSVRAGSREWSRLHCATAMVPGQNGVDPMIYSANVEFGDLGGRQGLMATMHFNNIVRAPLARNVSWRIDGTEGSMWIAADGNVQVTRADDPDRLVTIPISGSWFPDAFIGPMGDLISATNHHRSPEVPPSDNFNTVAMTSAMVRSSIEGRVVTRSELFQEVGLNADLERATHG